MFHLLYLLLR